MAAPCPRSKSPSTPRLVCLTNKYLRGVRVSERSPTHPNQATGNIGLPEIQRVQCPSTQSQPVMVKIEATVEISTTLVATFTARS